ncbi:MAG TPA: formate dehydrogenase accessory sulfurtransferase FdhD [Planctomycetota bacterium]|nr:formate dehydrogenase accessory sulfurtransferase FdhD [Planctomycetota bacterium]
MSSSTPFRDEQGSPSPGRRRGPRPSIALVPVRRADGSVAEEHVVVEEPLEVRLGTRSLLITMRTPGADLDLVRGMLFTEGLLARAEDLGALQHCADVPPEAAGNVVTVSLVPGASLVEEHAVRVGLVTSACGVCGKATLAAIGGSAPTVRPGPALRAELVLSLPAGLSAGQALFARTGGLHAAALFAADGRRLALAEDVGRHNAVDKVVGEALRFRRVPLHDTLLMVSGRTGFEIVQKARRAGIPVIASVSAPSSLAIDLARDGGQTLIGFVRERAFNVYCGAERFSL